LELAQFTLRQSMWGRPRSVTMGITLTPHMPALLTATMAVTISLEAYSLARAHGSMATTVAGATMAAVSFMAVVGTDTMTDSGAATGIVAKADGMAAVSAVARALAAERDFVVVPAFMVEDPAVGTGSMEVGATVVRETTAAGAGS
jgi:hypothetical protein